MRARASNLMIGTLTLALIAGSLGAFLGYQKLAGIKQQVPFRVIFEGSASGLRKGGSVNFSGIRVGEVVSLKLDHPRRVVALAMIDGNTPVKSDTQVGLEFQGLTGIAAMPVSPWNSRPTCVSLLTGVLPSIMASATTRRGWSSFSDTTSPTRMPEKLTLPPLRSPEAEPSKITRNGTCCLMPASFW